MKKYLLVTLLVTFTVATSQVRNNVTPSNGSITNNTPFLDASSGTFNSSVNIGKGVVFPRTDLVAMTTLVAPVNGIPNAFPTRLGTPVFKVGGVEGGFNKVSTIYFTNSYNYVEKYDIYKSTNAGLGNTTVDIS